MLLLKKTFCQHLTKLITCFLLTYENTRNKPSRIVVKHKLKKIVTKIKNGEEKEKVDVKIIFRKQELAPTEMGFLEYLKYVRHGGAWDYHSQTL